MLNYLIIGNPPMSNALKPYLQKIKKLNLLKIVTETSNLRKIEEQKPDVIFADLKTFLRERPLHNLVKDVPYVVFITKKVTCGPLVMDMSGNFFTTQLNHKTIANIIIEIQDDIISNFKNKLCEPIPNDFCSLKIYLNGQLKEKKIRWKDIIYIKACDDFTQIYLENDVQFLSPLNLKQVQKLLDHSRFLRVHKGYLVNTIKVQSKIRNTIGLSNNQKIPIGRSYKPMILEAFEGIAL